MPLAPNARVPAFRYTVGGIVFRRTEKQMMRVHATPVVAVMTHEHPFRDRSVIQLPHYTTSLLGLAISGKHAVSRSLKTCCPRPTLIRATNSNPVSKSTPE